MNNPAKDDGSRFDSLVDRYYPAVYSFAARLTEDPRDANDLARAAFRNTRRQLTQLRNQTAIATILISAVIRAGLGAA
jgi:DNA-directed RNA polymerase specialized sigma24 family protein